MVSILVIVILLLLFVAFYLNISFYREKKTYERRLEALQRKVAEISLKGSGQRDLLRLSDELDQNLKASNAVLSHDIFGLTFELLEILSRNKLLRK